VGFSKLVSQEVDPNEVPEPYYSLLVHEGDMTSRLESYHQEAIQSSKA
jgi:hypothetical protein